MYPLDPEASLHEFRRHGQLRKGRGCRLSCWFDDNAKGEGVWVRECSENCYLADVIDDAYRNGANKECNLICET